MARTVIANDYGDSDVLSIVTIADPEPRAGQVLIAVKAIGVNMYDIKRQRGLVGNDPAQLPLHFGFEAAGVIHEIEGDAVGPFGPLTVGDDVCVSPASNTYTDLLVADASSCWPRPDSFSWEQAAGFLSAGSTAYHAFVVARPQSGQTLLVHGAAGGVGQMVVQLAVNDGVRVIGTASESQHGLLRELGAEPVVYGDGLLDRVRALASNGVDAVVDAVGTDEAIDVSLALVDNPSRIASVAAFQRAGDGIALVNAMTADEQRIRIDGRRKLIELAQHRKLTVSIDRSFPLDHVADAHDLAASGHTHGKIILIP